MQNTRQILGFLNLLNVDILLEFVHCTIKFSIDASKIIINSDNLLQIFGIIFVLVLCSKSHNVNQQAIYFIKYRHFKVISFQPIFDLAPLCTNLLSVGIRTSGHLTGQNFQKP
ncbi:hypothetical protein BpHYR1_015631 [Brachionus plicatilis]|uniref:Uncharacterized protein n=1 Tax=Brachionus plicatilis TaxID=10195 RepID=A0A3M7PZA2_BRAPC|nr:hypothetical protein BpHYR1_015631 [Brachionus plicatilis]